MLQAAETRAGDFSSCSVVCALVTEDHYYFANLGDTGAVLVGVRANSHEIVFASKQHTPSVYEEQARIKKDGGMVFDGRLLGELAASRALGAFRPYKQHGPELSALSAAPTCTAVPRRRSQHIGFLLASGGLLAALSCDELMRSVTEVRLRLAPPIFARAK